MRSAMRFITGGGRGLEPVAVAAAVLAAALVLVTVPANAQQSVRVVNDEQGSKLQVDGEDFMVFGMNWDYFPIGYNYLFNIWDQSDEFIVTALERDMPMLRRMGVNAIRVYTGIPPRWVEYIYRKYGIFTILNHSVGRYGYTVEGVWIPSVDYSDRKFRDAVTAEILGLVEEFEGTPGLLMWLLGNENNYGLHWTSFEIEALPEGQRDEARARHLYSLYQDIIEEIKRKEPGRIVAIANGDIQYLDIVAEECPDLDVFGSNVYRGISARDFFARIEETLGIPAMFTEFGADAWNARRMEEDQLTQAKYLLGQWKEIYEQSYGKGKAGNAIGGLIFQWTDGWWKFGQESRLDIHDTNASWPNAAYPEDYTEGEFNMNEEWWGITAKGPTDQRGLYEVYPRAAYYALEEAFELDPYAEDTGLEEIEEHFGSIFPGSAYMEARSDRAALLAEKHEIVHLSGLRMELETFYTGGDRVSTPESPAGVGTTYPAFQGFDHLESFYVEAEARPTEAVTGRLSVNILGNVPVNPIDQIFYENRGRPRLVDTPQGNLELNDIERVKVYQASVNWDDRWFFLEAFYRTGHTHWGYEGDFFGLYRDAYYGENIDIYNGLAPIGMELTGKKLLRGFELAYGPQLWWGANPAVLLKYGRTMGPVQMTAIYQEDLTRQSRVTSSFAIPLPEDRKITLALKGSRGPASLEVGGIVSGLPKVGEDFQVVEEDPGGGMTVLQDEVKDSDVLGVKAKLTVERGRWHWYAQTAYMGAVAEGGPTATTTFTGWTLKDTGSSNQFNFLSGLAINLGSIQVAPNFLYQKPLVDPIPADAPPPARPRNVLDDPFAVLGNRETIGAELMISYDPTPATWMWQWDNDLREDAPLAVSVGYTFRHHPTTRDASIGILADGRTTFAFDGAPPARDLGEVNVRVVSAVDNDTRLVGHLFYGTGEPNGNDPRLVRRWGGDARLAVGSVVLSAFARFNDWGPYDYHRDFNLTFPVQLMGDVAYTLASPRWFGFPQTKIGIMGLWRTLNEHSPRYCPGLSYDASNNLVCDPTLPGDNGNEWEIRTYMHFSL